MSDNEHALPVLRDSEVLSVKHFPLAVVPDRIQRQEDGGEGGAAVVAKESLDVLKEYQAWSLLLCNPYDLKEKRSAGIAKASALASNRESLAREAADKEVEAGKDRGVDRGDVAVPGVVWEVPPVYREGVPVDFAVADTYGPQRVCVVTAGYRPAASKIWPRSPQRGI